MSRRPTARGRRTVDPPAAALLAPRLIGKRLAEEWRSTGLYGALLSRPRASGVAAEARDFRPIEAETGRQALQGRMQLAGVSLRLQVGVDIWQQPCPSRAFAVALHRFDWLPALAGEGPAGLQTALRLILDWERSFERVTPFAWSLETLQRRVYNLACALKTLSGAASDREAQTLAISLARQGRHLLRGAPPAFGESGRAVAVAVAGAVLEGRAGADLTRRGLERLARSLPEEVFPDGGVASRSPEAALELLFDLLTLDDVLLARGREAPAALSQAIDRLSLGVRFFMLGDRRLGSFHGGETSGPARVAAALAHEDPGARAPAFMPYGGYHRLEGQSLVVLVDAAPPAEGRLSEAACAQPLALEVTAGRDRLISNCGWSPDAAGLQAFRLTAAGSTASVGDASAGRVLSGVAARALGPRLVAGAKAVAADRHENEHGVWLELRSDGFLREFGVLHHRRLFLDVSHEELRGEDWFEPVSPGDAPPKRLANLTVRFHLPADVQVSLARDKRSVLLRGPSNRGWWLRNDARDVSVEPSMFFEDRRPHRSAQVVLASPLSFKDGARVRWKLAPVEASDPRASSKSVAKGAAAATNP